MFKQRVCNASSEQIIAASNAGQPDPCGPEGTYVDKEIGLTGEFLDRAFAGRDPVVTARNQVHVEFNSTGTSIFRDLTETLFDMGPRGRIAMFLDDELISAPTVTTPIRDGRGVITGGFTRQSARDLAIQLESGRLPIPLALIRESTVDALLGSDSLRKSLTAGLVGLGLVLAFMLLYYRIAGLVAGTALLIYAVIVLAILKLLPGTTITLSGIAGLVLSVGFAVDANILIFERMKEEMRTGRTLTSAMEVGFRRAWVAIRDSNFSTILTCAILFLFGSRLGGGTPVVTGFAITLLIGVCVSMFTALTVSRNMLQILALTPAGRKTSLFSPEPQKAASGCGWGRSLVLDIVGKRAWFFLISGLILLPGIIALIIPPALTPGIEFTSGTVLDINFTEAVSEEDIRAQLNDLDHTEALIQKTGSRSAFIRTDLLEEAVLDTDGTVLKKSERSLIEEALSENVSAIESTRIDSVSPIVARETVRNASIVVFLAAVGILVYVTWAFRRVPNPFRYGVAAIIALVHDMLLILGIFSILGKVINMEVNSMFIVGLLTVLGYSVNDTIVVFDRIRENVARNIDRPLPGIVNTSIMETIGRSLNTSATTLFVLLALLLFGGPTIRGLLLVLTIGVVVGTYSSIGIASQFLVIWDRGEIRPFLSKFIPFVKRAPAAGG